MVGLIRLVAAGVVPQSQSEGLDEDVVVDHLDARRSREEQLQDRLSKRGSSLHPSVTKPKSSATTAAHKSSSSKVGSSLHLPDVVPKSSTRAADHKSSTSHLRPTKSASAAIPKSSTIAGGHKPSIIKPGIANKGKGTNDILSEQTSKGKLKPDPSLLGPQSKEFLKGPYGPMFDINNIGSSGRTGDQIDPIQAQLWSQQGATKNRGVPPGSKLHVQPKREVQTCSIGEGSNDECQRSDNSSNPPARHSLWSRFTSLVKRTIGAQSSVTGIIPQNNQPFSVEQLMVFNGQPGMIWLKQKGDITYCPTDDHHNIIGDFKIYVPSIFFTDMHNRKRCNEPCFLFWVSGGGQMYADRFAVGKPNFQRVLIAGQCNDCYPWEIQAEGAVIDLIAANLTVDWSRGLWGPTLALGTNEDFQKG